jgi:hypothetical protein
MSELRKVEGMARRMVENLKSELQPTLLSLNSSFTSKLIELDNTFSGIAQQINNLALQDSILSNNLGKERDKFTEDTLAYRIAKRDFTGTTTQDSIDTSLTSVLAVNVDTDMTIDALQNLIFTYDATVYFYAQVKTYDKDTGLLGFQITKAAGTPGIYSPWTIKLGDRQISDSFGTTANTVCEGNDPRLSNARTPTAHTHALSDITQSSAATDQVPAWNGTNWVPATRASLSSANTFTALQTFTSGIEANAVTLTGDITLQNSEFVRNSTNGRIDLMPNGTSASHYGIYFDTTSWGFGTILGTIRASDGAINTGGNIRFDVPLTILADTRFQLGSDGHYGFYRTDTGNNTGQIYALSNNANNSGAIALVDYFDVGNANRSPATSHSNPNLYIYRRGTASADDFIRIEHDGTNGALYSGGTTNIALNPGSGTVKVNNKLTLGTSTLNSSVAGCVEYDGKVTYANTASGRGLMVTEQTSILTSSRNINSATGNQNIFGTPQDVITLAANTTYMIRGYLFLSMGTTTTRHIALRFTESLSANPPTIHFSTIGMPSTGGAALRTQDMAYFVTTGGGNITNATITTASYNAWITGVITTVDSVTITPQIAFSAAPGNTCSVNMGTFISFIPYGSNTMAAVGPWS